MKAKEIDTSKKYSWSELFDLRNRIDQYQIMIKEQHRQTHSHMEKMALKFAHGVVVNIMDDITKMLNETEK